VSTVALFVDVLGPVVLLVAIGAIAGPRLGISPASLSPLAYWVLGPAFVFDLFAADGVEAGTVGRLAVAGLAGMAAAITVAAVGNRLIGSSPSITSASVITSGYGNVGNAGLAMTVFALGDEALAAAGVLMLVINIAGITFGVGVASRHEAGLGGAIGRALVTPMTLAAALAIAINLLDLDTPVVVERSAGLLAGALIPVMLFTLGLQLAITGRPRLSADIGITAVAKLAVAPLAATGVAFLLGLNDTLLGAVAIQSAMPPAVFTLVLAMEHDLEPDRVTAALVTVTVASLVTIPIVLLLTQP